VNHYPFRNLVFEGGGVKGIAYVGALEVLERRGILGNIQRVAGTSAGAIIALLVGLNYSQSEIREIMMSMDFKKFCDSGMWLSDAIRVFRKYGWYKGDFFEEWIGKLVEKKTGTAGATFRDVNAMKDEKGFKDLYFLATNLSTHYAEVFSFEKEAYRDISIVEAVRRSMSIPVFFRAKRNQRGDVYVDGGVLNNYPVKVFDRSRYVESESMPTEYYDKHNEELRAEGLNIDEYIFNQETLGFRLDSETEIGVFRDEKEPQHNQIDSFANYVEALVKTIMASQDNRHIHTDDWHRTVYINTLDAGTTEFDMSHEKKLKMIDSGRKGTDKYFDDWYDDRQTDMLNRPDRLSESVEPEQRG